MTEVVDSATKQLLLSKNVDNRVKTEDVKSKSGSKFEDFPLKRDLLLGIYEKGFDLCSPIQEVAIPVILAGKSCLARGKNGTGKTAAYAVPMLQYLDLSIRHTQAVVIVPSRELAMQTSAVIKELGHHLKGPEGQQMACMVTTGGTFLRDDILRLNDAVHVIVGTVGRLFDLSQKSIANLSHVKFAVLDEADKLLSEEFTEPIEGILGRCHADKQLLLFSATFPSSVDEFRNKHIPDAEKINTMSSLTLQGITQYYAFVDERHKLHCLNTLLTKLEIQQCIVFCNSVNRVEMLAKKLQELSFPCYFIHSRMTQTERNKVFHEFRTGGCRFLVCSDLLTRGIDVQSVNVVINFDFPKTSESYLHRIGRSGRFGHLGLAVNLVCMHDREFLFRVEEELKAHISAIPANVDPSLYS